MWDSRSNAWHQSEILRMAMTARIKVLVVGVGNMGASHALAYKSMEGFELVGLMSRSIRGRNDLAPALADIPRFDDFDAAIKAARPDAVSINTWPDTHAAYALKALAAG